MTSHWLIFLSLFLPLAAHAQPTPGFSYRYQVGELYNVLTDVRQKVYINDNLSHEAIFENRISVEVQDVQADAGLLDARYRVIEQSATNSAIRRVARESAVQYWRDSQGNTQIGRSSFVPQVRGIPAFPRKQPTVGQSWSRTAKEVFDLRSYYGIQRPYPVDILVRYTYLGEKLSSIDGEQYPALAISYAIDHKRNWQKAETNRIIPVIIEGLSRQEMLWDKRHGRPHSYHDQYRLEFVLLDGRRLRIVGEAEGHIQTTDIMKRQEIQQEIQQQLQDSGLEDTEVDTAVEGVRINLEHILFHPDTDQLLPGEEEKVTSIAAILKRYNHRDKLVIGHTAHVGTETGRQQLSERRAEVVALLLQRAGIEKIITQGMGSQFPVADNTTPEGRRKNRRVEIIILEN